MVAQRNKPAHATRPVLTSPTQVRTGQRFYVITREPVGILLYSGTFMADGDPNGGDYQRVLVRFDGENENRNKSVGDLGISDREGSLMCVTEVGYRRLSVPDCRAPHQKAAT